MPFNRIMQNTLYMQKYRNLFRLLNSKKKNFLILANFPNPLTTVWKNYTLDEVLNLKLTKMEMEILKRMLSRPKFSIPVELSHENQS